MLIGLNVIFGICISKLIGQSHFLSKLSLPFYACFHFCRKPVAFTWLTCMKKSSAAKSDKNIIIEGERSIKLKSSWKRSQQKIKKIKNIKLKWFQIRTVHPVLATNVVLMKMGIVNCSKCAFAKLTKIVLIIFFGSVVV